MLLLGHRGARASRQIPENTLASFELCLEHGCDGFEFDVRCSADGVPVICHDPVIRGMEIERTPASRLVLPTLEDVLRSFSSRAFLDIELKVPALEMQTLAVLRNHPPQQGYVLSSFLPGVLRAFHGLDRTLSLGFLCDKPANLNLWHELPQTWVIPRADLLDQPLVKELLAAGNKVMTWTVNRAREMRRLAEWGVDAIISDETELLVRTLASLER